MAGWVWKLHMAWKSLAWWRHVILTCQANAVFMTVWSPAVQVLLHKKGDTPIKQWPDRGWGGGHTGRGRRGISVPHTVPVHPCPTLTHANVTFAYLCRGQFVTPFFSQALLQMGLTASPACLKCDWHNRRLTPCCLTECFKLGPVPTVLIVHIV